jgi:hypothetical protein
MTLRQDELGGGASAKQVLEHGSDLDPFHLTSCLPHHLYRSRRT